MLLPEKPLVDWHLVGFAVIERGYYPSLEFIANPSACHERRTSLACYEM
jgi:hypothetical protein